MDMRPSTVFVKQVIATLVVITKEHSRPNSEQGKIIIHRPARFHIISVPGSAVVEESITFWVATEIYPNSWLESLKRNNPFQVSVEGRRLRMITGFLSLIHISEPTR